MGFSYEQNNSNYNNSKLPNLSGNSKSSFNYNKIVIDSQTHLNKNINQQVDSIEFIDLEIEPNYELPDLTKEEENWLLKAGATILNVGVSLVEGITSFGEAIVDCAIIIGGLVPTVGTATYDILINGVILGDWSFPETGALWKKNIMPSVATNFTDKTFDSLYSTSFMQGVDKNALGFAKRENENGEKGWLYSLGEGIGYYTGVALVTAATCGAGGVAISSTGVQASVMTTAAMGKNSQKNLNKAITKATEEDREVRGKEIFNSLLLSSGASLIEGGTYYFAGTGSTILKEKGKKELSKIVSTGIKSTKPWTMELLNTLNGEEFSVEDALIDTGAIIISETLADPIYNKVSGIFKNNKHTNSSSISRTVKNDIGKIYGASTDNSIKQNLIKEIVGIDYYKKAIKDIEKKSIKNTLKEGFSLITNSIIDAFSND